MQKLARLLCVGLVGMAVMSASAQTLVLKLAGISGESQVTGYGKDIDVASFSWGISTQISSSGQLSPPTLNPITITKPVDLSSPTLAQQCTNGTTITSGTLYCLRQQYGTNADFYNIDLSNVRITSVQSAPASFVPPAATPSTNATQFETLTLTFSSIRWTYYPVGGGSVSTTYP